MAIPCDHLFGRDPVLPPGTPLREKIVQQRLEAIQIAGFDEAEARKLFPIPGEQILDALRIDLRPPADVRRAFIERFRSIMDRIDLRDKPARSD